MHAVVSGAAIVEHVGSQAACIIQAARQRSEITRGTDDILFPAFCTCVQQEYAIIYIVL